MAEGTVTNFPPDRNYGFIKQDGEEKDTFFHISEWHGSSGRRPRKGDRVTFRVVAGREGKPAAKGVRLVGHEVPARQAVSARHERVSNQYDFLNPYNFVRPLPEPESEIIHTSANTQLLWRCPPPPHDRYLGLTGQIECTLEAKTPLFVSDSNAIEETKLSGDKKHYTYRFFEYDGKPAIPVTSLRGMIRSVFEAATNSCFAVFDEDRRLEFRERPEYGNKVKGNAGIVRKLASPGVDGQIELCEVGKVGAYYEGRESDKNVLGTLSRKCGDRVAARARRRRNDWLVTEIADKRSTLAPLQGDEEYIEGWLKITGRGEDTSKRSETLFLDPSTQRQRRYITYDYEAQQEYNFVLANQIKQGNLPANVQFASLSVGDLIWVDVPRQQSRARRLVRIQVPRVPYSQTIGQLLSNHLHQCMEYEALCPACRIFGWVHADPSEDKDRVAYAGRLRLTQAKPIEGSLHPLGPITLSILSSPKPTTPQFYLLDQDGNPDGSINYNDKDARLRGRKVYRHHESKPSQHLGSKYEYEQVDGKQSDQNRTVCGALQPGAQFTFTLDFENLAPVELGALLWALELEDGMHHRLGYAKPLGFGSVKLTVTDLRCLNVDSRYRTLNANGGWGDPCKLPKKDHWINAFKEAMKDLYGANFDDLVNVQDLRMLLKIPDVTLPIHYPRLEAEPQPEGENFRWFVKNKALQHPHTLGLAVSDEGLPLRP